MSQLERAYRIDQLLNDRGVVSFDDLLHALEVSRATLRRDLAYLRDRLNAPIVHDRVAGGYRFKHLTQTTARPYELPGLWFSAEEIHALLTMQHLLANLDTGGLLGPLLAVQVGMGESILIPALVVIVIGGIGSVRGALVASLLVGLVDTAGRLAIDEALMGEIKDLHAVLNPVETLLVVDAMQGQDAANTARMVIRVTQCLPQRQCDVITFITPQGK